MSAIYPDIEIPNMEGRSEEECRAWTKSALEAVMDDARFDALPSSKRRNILCQYAETLSTAQLKSLLAAIEREEGRRQL